MIGLVMLARVVDRLGSRVSIDFGGLARFVVDTLRDRLGCPRVVITAGWRALDAPARERRKGAR